MASFPVVPRAAIAWLIGLAAMVTPHSWGMDPAPPATTAGPGKIVPGATWPDDRGEHIQAHGGGIIRLNGTYYWFGEYRAKDLEPDLRAVGCYASEDLVHWRFRGRAFQMAASGTPKPPVAARPAGFPGKALIVERPKVFHNARTGKFVMYLHLDGSVSDKPGSNDYLQARVGVAVSDVVEGPYRFVKHFRPLGHESRDIGQFIDDDGTAYLIFEDRPNGFHIARLSDDYMDVERDVALIRAPLEGGALVHYQGLYYAIGSALTGWDPNCNVYATAKSLEGPWSEFRYFSPPETNTYNSQSTMMLKVVGTKTTTVIFMADMWKPKAQWDSRYLWMPLEIGDGRLRLPEPRAWTLDVSTGEAVIDREAPAMPFKVGKPRLVPGITP